MTRKVFLILLALVLALSVGLVACGGVGEHEEEEEVQETYDLTISSTKGGSVFTPGEGTGSFTYDEGAVVNLVAEADEGYRFVQWTGDVDTIANVSVGATNMTMNGSYSIMANFEELPPVQYNLSVNSTEGGSVDTPGEGVFSYDAGTVVNLVATLGVGYQFVSWTGNVGTVTDVSAASTNITMNGDYFITGNFEESAVDFPDYNLEVAFREAMSLPRDPIYHAHLECLTTFRADERNITDLAGLELCTNLVSLNLDHNEISDISPLVNLTNLEHLRLYDNQISDISPLANLTSLRNLFLHFNQISDISPLANLTSLRNLFLHYNQIRDISPLVNHTSLEYLWIGSNQMSDVSPLANLTNLTHLYLSENQISEISPLGNLTSLEALRLDRNQIGEISPLGNLTSLTTLYLQCNQVSDISPLGSLTSLTGLYLWDNQISDILPLVENEGLGTRDRVGLDRNPLSSDSINIYIPQLKARGVTVSY